MAEIYTGDLIEDAIRCAEKIGEQIGYDGYIIKDECCNLKREICEKIYSRLSIEINELIRARKVCDVQRAYLENELSNNLFKMINDL